MMDKLILQAHDLFKDTGFNYCICGGFALDLFAGKELRSHGDFDMAFYSDEKANIVGFVQENGFTVYGRLESGKIFYRVDDINDVKWFDCNNFWAVKPDSFAHMYPTGDKPGEYTYNIIEPRLQSFDFIELAFNERSDDDFFLQYEPKIRMSLDKVTLYKDDVPYMAPEMVLMLKTHPESFNHPYLKPKAETDFKAVMPLLSDESKKWLFDTLAMVYPNGYEWLDGLL